MRALSIFLTLFITAACMPRKAPIVVSGSNTMFNMAERVASAFMRENSAVTVTIQGGGSLEGLKDFERGEADIALMSRELEPEEVERLKRGGAIEQITLAYDGLAVVVHKDNPLKSIRLLQLSQIFSGEIRDWKDVGGAPGPIIVLVRNDKSGTYEYFRKHVVRRFDLGGNEARKASENDFTRTAIVLRDNDEMAEAIEKGKGAIGFMGMGQVTVEHKDQVRPLAYAVQPGDPLITPSLENVYNGTYPLSRPLFMIYRTGAPARVLDFITFATSEAGQKLVMGSGYLRNSLPEVRVSGKKL
ncbi:MAG: PstS family phosphate ABC transporter substrate-binding protein [Leptospirales bacterium]|nr:PstS family phosphate ABC transporter substrate-binding protein [Leptospirales bacterium]